MTSRTPGRLSKMGASTAPLFPVMPMAVRWLPGMGCAFMPRASTAATTPRMSSGVALCRITTSMSGPGGETALLAAVREVEDEPGGEPQDEALPGHEGKAGHQEEAHRGAEEGDHGNEGHPELPRPVRLLGAQDQDADAHEHEREERPDVRELDDLVDVGEGGEEGHERASHDRSIVGGA